MTTMLLFAVVSGIFSPGMPLPDLHGKMCQVSWYKHGQVMANGDKFNPKSLVTIAHKTLPFGTKVLMISPRTGKWLICEVQDRGPYHPRREFDLAQGAARYLGVIDDPEKNPKLMTYVIPQPLSG
ncbi:MAG: septal ring lytic transglycosylase RlpA family protein [Patescibacteria group bacterium]|jgi:hypothetical protein